MSQLDVEEEFLGRMGPNKSEFYIYAWVLRHHHGLDDHMLLGHVLAAVSLTAYERDNLLPIDRFKREGALLTRNARRTACKAP